MSARTGEPFATERAVSDVEDLLVGPLPATGPTVGEGDPDTGEWTATSGAGFRIVPLWEGDPLTGVYAPEWNDAEEAAEAHLASLVAELDARWGAHRAVATHVPLLRKQEGAPLPPLFEALLGQDLYGDLTVWGPVPVSASASVAGPVGAPGRWIAVCVGHSDGDAPLVMAALVSDRPVTELPSGER
ncbi:hypothetical protein OG413_01875 [Streptomyces sp. NBC_01433]|uniref:hypothetical protein n=1 Tax=Streptomyces sp. NBC_01433 TaxID=2903864 RepID=UPI00224E3474|nr:hypothetical protein [Streptomyces sp. NBC_01433]MCX4674073.1 hypothetical protein [Streptomyces sp. NBC_01433]